MKVLKNYLILATSTIILLSFNGCTIIWGDPEHCEPKIEVQKEIIYLNKKIPDLVKSPKALDYNISYINYNDVTYYQLLLEDGEILKLNWNRYKSWAESNYKILKNLKENNQTKER